MNKKIIVVFLLLIAIVLLWFIGISIIKNTETNQEKIIDKNLAIQISPIDINKTSEDNKIQLKGCLGGICEYDYVMMNETNDIFTSRCDDCEDECDDKCEDDEDCDDDYYGDNYCIDNSVYRDFYDFYCNDGDCEEEIIKEFVKDCGQEEICYNGVCAEIICSSDVDCDDADYYTIDECHNPGTTDSYCTNAPIECILESDCGVEEYSDSYCIGNEVYRYFNDFSCSDYSCLSDVTQELVENCGEDECSDWGEDYCVGDDVYKSRNCYNQGCESGSCFEEDYDEDELVEECADTCVDGECADIECYKNSDCGIDGLLGQEFCMEDNLFDFFRDYSCINPGESNSYCYFNDNNEFIEDCGNDYCDSWDNDYCVGDDVYRERMCAVNGCSNGGCVSSFYPESDFVKSCSVDEVCDSGSCVPIGPVDCCNNADCEDFDFYTYDKCHNPGTSSSYCTNTPIDCVINADCGTTGLFGQEYCSNNDIFKNFQTSTCVNPGELNSYCDVEIIPTFLVDCGEYFCDMWDDNYCKEDNVYHARTCYDNGCDEGVSAICSTTLVFEEELVQDCLDGCASGMCIS